MSVGEFAQSLKGVDSAVMAIAPVDADRVATHRVHLGRMDILGNFRRVELVFARPLVDAQRTGAGETQRSHIENALNAVFPLDTENPGTGLADLDRNNSGSLTLHPIDDSPENRVGRSSPPARCMTRPAIAPKGLRERYAPAP